MAKGNRIKYIDHKFRENSKISLRSYTSEKTGAKYRIVLDLNEMKYFIRNERTKEFVFKSKDYTNMNVLKRNARAELERFGVNLNRESRDRSFGLCKQGYNQQTHEMLEKLTNED